MKAISDAVIASVEKHELIRAMRAHEGAANAIRSQLGLVQREVYESIAAADSKIDGITRLRTDQLDRLYDSKKINAEQRDAAFKFRRVWESMSRGMFPQASAVGGMVGTKSRGSYRHPLERMTNKELHIWLREYKPWANGPAARSAINVERGAGPFQKSFLQVCYAILIDGYGPAQLEQIWPVTRGKSIIVRALQKALSDWVHLEYDERVDLEQMRDEIVAAAQRDNDHALRAVKQRS